jgi:DNA-binding NtrC family response regulator
LLVEDDATLKEAEKNLLAELGYKVTALTSSVEALELFRKVPDRFDVVVTDFVMPKLTGIQLTIEIHSLRPDIPVIICTGYSDVLSQQKAESMGIGDVIMKPINLSRVAKSIRKLIDKKQESAISITNYS